MPEPCGTAAIHIAASNPPIKALLISPEGAELELDVSHFDEPGFIESGTTQGGTRASITKLPNQEGDSTSCIRALVTYPSTTALNGYNLEFSNGITGDKITSSIPPVAPYDASVTNLQGKALTCTHLLITWNAPDDHTGTDQYQIQTECQVEMSAGKQALIENINLLNNQTITVQPRRGCDGGEGQTRTLKWTGTNTFDQCSVPNLDKALSACSPEPTTTVKPAATSPTTVVPTSSSTSQALTSMQPTPSLIAATAIGAPFLITLAIAVPILCILTAVLFVSHGARSAIQNMRSRRQRPHEELAVTTRCFSESLQNTPRPNTSPLQPPTITWPGRTEEDKIKLIKLSSSHSLGSPSAGEEATTKDEPEAETDL